MTGVPTKPDPHLHLHSDHHHQGVAGCHRLPGRHKHLLHDAGHGGHSTSTRTRHLAELGLKLGGRDADLPPATLEGRNKQITQIYITKCNGGIKTPLLYKLTYLSSTPLNPF